MPEEHVHRAHKPFECQLCGKAFKVKAYLTKHVRIVHKNLYPFKCPTCSKPFKYRYRMNQHLYKAHHEEIKSFENCQHHIEPRNMNILDTNQQKCFDINRSTENCEVIDLVSDEEETEHDKHKILDDDEEESLDLHLSDDEDMLRNTKRQDEQQAEQKNDSLKHKCDICANEFLRVTPLELYRKKCSLCGKYYVGESAMKRHRSIAHENSYSCDICGASFTYKSSLKSHIDTHAFTPSYSCKICGSTFIAKVYHTRHMDTCHSQKSKKLYSYRFV